MKRTVPILITAVSGLVLVVAFFIPGVPGLRLFGQDVRPEAWGEAVAVWFDILAAIAFVLGGGNLIKVHLKKVSDRARGWGYSVVTVVAFLTMLYVGLAKRGSAPAGNQEFYGETFAALPLEAFPDSQVARLPGRIPERGDGAKLPPSARRQFSQQTGAGGEPQLVFRGWMSRNQLGDLKEYEDELDWQCQIETLHRQAQPPDPLKGKVNYYIDHEALSFSGYMADEQRDALLAMSDDPRWVQAVQGLYQRSRFNPDERPRVAYEELPARFELPEEQQDIVEIDTDAGQLVARAPVSMKLKTDLARKYSRYPLVKPLSTSGQQALLDGIERRGKLLTEGQRAEFNKLLAGTWTVQQLREALDAAGQPQETDKTACEMLAELQAAAEEDRLPVIDPKVIVGEETALNDAQVLLLEEFANSPQTTVGELATQLAEAGAFTDGQREALEGFFAQVPTLAEQKRRLWQILVQKDPGHELSVEQREFLLNEFRRQQAWQAAVDQLFAAAHRTKYAWSGAYRDQGNPFWWLYEYVFKPLTATMFALLAFYVASAAFRAFRAKNIEAILLLGTAFIILLGRTFAGVYLTGWLPDDIAGLKIENLSMWIMQVFNTAGNRAIMIGIALGIASTSLKVLLGVDRSYLGSRE